MKVELIRQADIDKVKWNSCVHFANNGNVYGYMWFLDNVAKEWDALVEGDYESVFPLVWRENFLNVKELYQPSLIRELGVYSINVLSQARIKKFLEAIPDDYKRINVTLNEQNPPTDTTDFQWQEKTNHQLLLDEPYEKIREQYSDKLKAALEAAENSDIKPLSNPKPERIAEFYQKYAKDRRELTRNFHALQRIMYNVLHRGKGFATGVVDENEELCAVNFYIYSHHKIISLVPVVSPKGRAVHAMPYLIDMLIRTHANHKLILDFNVDELDEWAADFGSTANIFYHVKRDTRRFGLF